MESVPYNLDTRSRTDDITAAVSRLIARGGMGAVTMRAIAGETGVSQSALAHHLTNRDRLMSMVAWRTGLQYLQALGARRLAEGVLAFLPATATGVVQARVWLAWCELGRSDQHVGPHVARICVMERWLLGRSLGLDVPEHEEDDDLDTAMALVRGLRAAVCVADEPMPTDRARRLLERSCAGYPAEAASALARSSPIIRSGSAAE